MSWAAVIQPKRKGARVVEEARLESVYSPKGNRRFESYPFRNCFWEAVCLLCIYCIYISAYMMKHNTLIARLAILLFTLVASSMPLMAQEETMGFHQSLKTKFIEGNAGFMSLVAIALVIGLAFCIERILYLSLSEINAKRLLADIDRCVEQGDVEGAKTLCRNTRGPVASICCQGLMRIDDSLEDIERSVVSYGTVQAANLEKGCSWITLFIAMAPSLGFLGTVIGMVMAFDQIQQAGDISPTIVASGMKVALITTIFGIIVALVLQVFYNYILSKIEHIVSQMEESAITLMDIIAKHKKSAGLAK